MNDNNLFIDAFDAIDDELIADAKNPNIRIAARRKKIIIGSIAACVAAVLVAIPSVKILNNSNNNRFINSDGVENAYKEEVIYKEESNHSEQTNSDNITSKPQPDTSSKSEPPASSKVEDSSNIKTEHVGSSGTTIKVSDLYFIGSNAPDSNGSTTSYEKVYSPNVEYLYINPIPHDKYVTIYKGYYEKEINQQEAISLSDEFFPKFSSVLGTTTPEYIIHSYPSYINIEDKFANNDYYGVNMSVTSMPNRNILKFSNFKNPVSINGQIFTINGNQTDDAIIVSLETLKQELFDLFNVSFDDTKVVRHFNGIYDDYTIYLYNSNAHILNDHLGSNPYTDYISIAFNDYNNKLLDTYYVSDIWYWSFRTKNNSHSVPIAQKELLPLQKAEEYLSKGYVLAYRGCLACQGEQPSVDFANYDHVSFEYKGGFNVGVLAIPYYAFYKNIGTDENGNMIFAKTYVPAIEVEGYEEYFINKHNNHNNTNNSNIEVDEIIDNPKPPA